MFDRIEFLISEALTALKRNTWMTFAAITTSCMALFLTGGVAFAYKGISDYAALLPSRFEMRIFLKEGVSPTDAAKDKAEFAKIPGVKDVVWLPRDKAWANFRVQNPDYPTEGLENPLPDAFTLTLSDVDKAEGIAKTIAENKTVAPDGVVYLKREREMLSQALGFLRLIGIALGGLMLITSGVLIYNAIRMTIVARRREFNIMRLVGATSSTITIPLLIEGVIQGVIGGVLASLLVKGSHNYLYTQLGSFSGIIKMGPLSYSTIFISLVSLGAVYGLVCSLIAIRDKKKLQS